METKVITGIWETDTACSGRSYHCQAGLICVAGEELPDCPQGKARELLVSLLTQHTWLPLTSSRGRVAYRFDNREKDTIGIRQNNTIVVYGSCTMHAVMSHRQGVCDTYTRVEHVMIPGTKWSLCSPVASCTTARRWHREMHGLPGPRVQSLPIKRIKGCSPL